MNKLTGIKDLDREILERVDDKELLTVCSIDKRMWNEVCDDVFMKRRLMKKYPGIEKYKPSWKEFFLDVTKTVADMKDIYGFTYTGGNYKKQYKLLQKNWDNINHLMTSSAIAGELSLVIYAFSNGADFLPNMQRDLAYAVREGHLDIVKFFVEKGVTPSQHEIDIAVREKHPEIVEYLRSEMEN